MGWFSTLGSKLSSTAHSLGQKANSVAKKVGKVADTVADVSGGVASVTGALGAGAAMIGAEPLAAGLLATAAAAKAVQGVSMGVSAGAGLITGAYSAAEHTGHAIDKIRAGHVIGAIKEAEQAVSAGQEVRKTGSTFKKEIERRRTK